MRDVTYTSPGNQVRNAYCGRGELVLQPGAVLPQFWVACGAPSWGNVVRKEFSWPGPLIYLPPFGIDLLFGLIFGKQYLFDFPFCPNCPPEVFSLKKTRVDDDFAVFVGAPKRVLEALPLIPANLVEEMSLNWIQRNLKWFLD